MTKICFIGGGNMASSLVGGLLAQGFKAEQIHVSDPNLEQRDKLQAQYSISTFSENQLAIEGCDVVVLAVKPQVMQQVISPLKDQLAQSQPLIISIAAGITIDSMQDWLGQQSIVRCMPNTPSLMQLGASGLFANAQTNSSQKTQAEEILSAVGIVEWVASEKLIDAVTAVSGSGPAYYFLMMEAMIDAGEKLGLDRKTAERLTLQTALGAAKMAQSSDVDVAELRRRVTSPKGTTEQAINSFEQDGLRTVVDNALQAADQRSAQLAKELAGSK